IGAGVLTGQVRASGTATGAPDATVVITDGHGEVIGTTTADETGEFRMEGLLGGPVTVTAQAPGHRPAVTTVDIQPGRTVGAALAVLPVGGLCGQVTADNGAAIADVTVALIAEDGEIAGTATTDEKGRYEVANLVGGD